MADGRKGETEFGGVEGQPFPADTGYIPVQYEELRRMYQTDPADPDSGSDIVTQKSA